MPKAKVGFVVKRPNEETVEISLDGQVVGTYTHDEVGWTGMSTVEELVEDIAEILKLTVTHE